jgi:hypothetical protein
MWKDFFKAGGFGMYPTLVFGLLLLAACVLYAMRPNARQARLAIALGIVTFAAGLLGAFSGMATSAHFIPLVPKGDQVEVLALGFAESLHDVVLALMIIVLGGLIATVGAFRDLKGA